MAEPTIKPGTPSDIEPPRCSHFSPNGQRCERPGTVWLYGPGDTQPIPGGKFCLECAQDIQAEYAEKLRECWTYAAGAR